MRKVLLSLLFVLTVAACNEDVTSPSNVRVDALQVSGPSRLFVDDTATLNVTVDSPESNVIVTWGSTNSQVAVVTNTGFVTVRSAGTTNIVVRAGGLADTLTLVAELRPVASVAFNGNTAFVGRMRQIQVALFDANGNLLSQNQRSFVWSSVDTNTVRVSPSGALTGVRVGTGRVNIAVQGAGLSPAPFSFDVTVTQIGVAYVTLTPDSVNVRNGSTQQFTAKAFASDSTEIAALALDGRTFTWTVADPTKGAISTNGTFTGLFTATNVGTTTVTAGIGPVTKTSKVVVTP